MKNYPVLPSLSYLQNCEAIASSVYGEYCDGDADLAELEHYDDRVSDALYYYMDELGLWQWYMDIGQRPSKSIEKSF